MQSSVTREMPTWLTQYGPELERHLERIVEDPDDAADLLQSVWLRALERLDPAPAGLNVRAWLYRVGTHAALDLIAHRKRWRGRLAHWGADPERRVADPPPVPLSDRTRNRVLAELKELPRKQRDAVWFRWVDGLSYAEIARKLACSAESARSNVYHGLKRLRQTLADLSEEV